MEGMSFWGVAPNKTREGRPPFIITTNGEGSCDEQSYSYLFLNPTPISQSQVCNKSALTTLPPSATFLPSINGVLQSSCLLLDNLHFPLSSHHHPSTFLLGNSLSLSRNIYTHWELS